MWAECLYVGNKMENEQKEQETLLEAVAEYEPKQTLLISDLDFFSLDERMETRIFKEGTEDEFKVKVLVRDGKDYRVPWGVLGDIKELLKKNEKFKAFQVIKTGTGREGTKYRTIPHVSGK